MGLEASLKLLDLPPDATIDDANQAYAYLQRMIDLFHQDPGEENQGGRQADIELLTCAYEKAVAYLFDRDSRNAPSAVIVPPRSPDGDVPESADRHFTINFSADMGQDEASRVAPPLPEPNTQTVEEAVSITSRRLQQTESALPEAQQAVESATIVVVAANRQHESAKQASLNALVAAKSAKTRALLLEIEAKRAMADAIAAAEKARDRVVVARQEAREAVAEAGKARDRVCRIKRSEETAAAEAVCAEDRLEEEKVRLKALTHSLIAARSRMKMFQNTTAVIEKQAPETLMQCAAMPDNPSSPPRAVDGEAAARQQIASDLLDIEESLEAGEGESIPADASRGDLSGSDGPVVERRQHRRLVYPPDRRPVLSIDGRSIPIHDLSTAGMCLEPGNEMAHPRVVRGAIDFGGCQPVKITGKVVRRDACGLGLKLLTHIGNHIFDQERLRLSASCMV